MMLRTRALVAIGVVLLALTTSLGGLAHPLVRRSLDEQSRLAQELAAIRDRALAEPDLAPAELAAPKSGGSGALWRLWLAVGLAGLAAPVLCGIALRALFAPVGALQRACENVAGWGSARPLAEGRGDELGVLCDAFDRMRATLDAGHRRLQRHNDELEGAVSQKTRQLAATVERLRSLDQMKDAFLSCASRELQGPVRAIAASCAELRRAADPAPRGRVLAALLEHCRALDRTAQDVLDLVRTQCDGFDFAFEPTTVQAVVRRAVTAVRERGRRADVELQTVQLGDCRVVWDEGWIARVLEAVLLDAIEPSPAAATVVLECRVQGSDVRLEIRAERRDATDDRSSRALWAPVVERHLGEWTESQTETQRVVVLLIPALAEHLRWQYSPHRASVEPAP